LSYPPPPPPFQPNSSPPSQQPSTSPPITDYGKRTWDPVWRS
jgi:hypothetical protein